MKPKLVLQPIALLPASRRVLAAALSFCLLAMSGAADARSRSEEAPERDGKRHTLRNVLTSAHDADDRSGERRRLNAEERSALHRDLRDAMRGAYPDQPGARKKAR